MAEVCGECGASNPEGDRFCRNCGKPLSGSIGPITVKTLDSEQTNLGAWVATMSIGVLLLCCLGVIGIAFLDELAAAHPLRTLLVGTPTPASTFTPTATFTATGTPISAPTHTPTPEPGADSFEPDDSITQASEIDTDGTPQTHTLSPVGDRDCVSFQAREGMEYTIETADLGDECDTVLTLYDEHETDLANDDDGGDEPLASRLTWIADKDGIFFVAVTHFDEGAAGEDTDYDLWVLESEPASFEEDQYEPDDTTAQAHEILLDTPQTHDIHVPGDHDWSFFQAEEGVTYVIETSNLGSGIDTIMYLCDEDGEELAQDDDGGEESLASRIIWSADANDILYVMVRDYWDDRGGPDTHYDISVTEDLPLEPDSYEPDDTQDQAAQIEIGLYQSHSLHVTGDHDWLFFQATEGTTYVIQTFNLGSRIDTVIYLYDAEGHELANDDDRGDEPLASRLTWTAEEDGALYIMVQDLEDDAAGPGTEYGISASKEGAPLLISDEYEPDDTMAESRDIELGEVQTHNFHVEGDHDWLSFQAMEGTTYIIETFNLGQEVDTTVFLYDENGEELAQDDDGADEPRASLITWAAEKDGTSYVMVRDYKDNRASRDTGYDIVIRHSEYEIGETTVHASDVVHHTIGHQTDNFIAGISEPLFFENFTLEADAAQVSAGNDNVYGLVHGYQDDNDYHELAVSGDGYDRLSAEEEGR